VINVLIAEDHTLVRKGLKLLLEEFLGVRVVGEAADGMEALRLIEKLHPDVVLMDIAMPGLNGLDAIARAVKAFPATKICVLSGHSTEAYVHQALAAGAAGYLLKGADRAELEAAIRTVASGRRHISPAFSPSTIAALGTGLEDEGSPLVLLTTRQREILQLIAEGRSTKEIAQRLDLSAKTVETHRANLMSRLGIRDVPGLVRLAVRAGLVNAER
jgi:DNA-binding NarL/FixJ family response regulator